MNYCVLVKISKRKISFWYQIEGSSYSILSIKGEHEMPLAFYINGNEFIMGNYARDRAIVGDPNAYNNYFELIKDPSKVFLFFGEQRPLKQLLYLGIERYLTHFLKEILFSSEWSIESNRPEFPLRIWFDQDIKDNEKILIINLFSEAGYKNIDDLCFEPFLLETLFIRKICNNSSNILLLTGIDNNLHLQLYLNSKDKPTFTSIIEGVGSDPRSKLLAELIFEDISINYPHLFLNKETEVAVLINEAKKALSEKQPLIMGSATLSNGKDCEYNVKIIAIEERLQYYTGHQKINTEIESILAKCNMLSTSIQIFLNGDNVNTDYFIESLKKKFPNVKGIESSYFIDTMKFIFSKIIQTGYSANKTAPILPPIDNVEKVQPAKPPIPNDKPTKPPIPNNNKPPLPSNNNLNQFIGKEGRVITQLNPIGKIVIDYIEYEAIAEIKLDKGANVKVIGVSVNKYLKVEKVGTPPPPPLPPPLPPKKN